MSTRANIIVKEEQDPRREIVLYIHYDGIPQNVVPQLEKLLSKIYNHFKQYGDEAWFIDPSKIAAMLITFSLPDQQEMNEKLKSMPEDIQKFVSQTLLKPIPTILPDNGRSPWCEYEYTVTLKEKMEDNVRIIGYQLEVARVIRGKKTYVIETLDRELFNSSKVAKTKVPASTPKTN